jgi:hypothetical protein
MEPLFRNHIADRYFMRDRVHSLRKGMAEGLAISRYWAMLAFDAGPSFQFKTAVPKEAVLRRQSRACLGHLGFAGAFRRSELVALNVEDLEERLRACW